MCYDCFKAMETGLTADTDKLPISKVFLVLCVLVKMVRFEF